MRTLGVFAVVFSLILAAFAFGAVIAGSAVVWGHVFLSFGAGALTAAIYWLHKNPPSDGPDGVTRLWRS